MQDADNEFVAQYEKFVRGVAAQLVAQLGLDCDVDDVVAYGFEGLLTARTRFDASKGIAFKSFAYYRVRGAMIDGVRTMAYMPRRAYARLRAAEAVDTEAEGASDTAAKAPGVEGSLRAVDGILGRVAAAYCVASCVEGEDGDPDATPEQALRKKQGRQRVRDALSTLPERERFLVQGHYLEGRRLDELAAELGLSKSWGSRLHTRALQLLRERLEDD
jgi:RNA polymerase sigma factor for flagellar operon FliA